MVESTPLLIPRAVCQSLVALGRQVDDPLSIICVEILAQLAMENPHLVSSVGGIDLLFHSIIHMEKFFESQQSALVTVATFLCNDSPHRRYLDLDLFGVRELLQTYEWTHN